MRPGGEYREEDGKDRSVWDLRTFFLEKVGELAPEVLEDLQTEVLPAYRKAYEATQPAPKRSEPDSAFGDTVTRRQAPKWVRWKFEDGDWEQAEKDELQALRTQLRNWAENYYLLEPWVLDAARRTLFFWYHRAASPDTVVDRLGQWLAIYPQASVKRVFAEQDVESISKVFRAWSEREEKTELRFHPPHFQDVFATSSFTFEFPSWVPQDEPWDAYENDLRNAFEQRLDGYEQRRRRRPEDRSLSPPPEIRNPNHFEWLVLWQVSGWTYLAIAQEYGLSTYEIPTGKTSGASRHAIHDKAELLGLTLRTQY